MDIVGQPIPKTASLATSSSEPAASSLIFSTSVNKYAASLLPGSVDDLFADTEAPAEVQPLPTHAITAEPSVLQILQQLFAAIQNPQEINAVDNITSVAYPPAYMHADEEDSYDSDEFY